ncbi:MAG: hypothetical protein D6781_14565 [Verrucomicrobia bacterium]|nr:MAG: hypothetical protein D6781_14565 [Verrucomicrobiota bacterium]
MGSEFDSRERSEPGPDAVEPVRRDDGLAAGGRGRAVWQRWGLRGWCLIWAVAAVVHLTQSVWLSAGAQVPGDALDGRFNNLVLEHGYQVLRGWAEWLSPGQYYPAKDTLGMSDTHAGTVPLYALARLAGLSMERAYQVWFVVVGALNALAFWRVFRAIGTPPVAIGPLLFLGVAPAVMVATAGSHAQLLPVFPAVFALDQGIRFLGDRCRFRLAVAAGWWCWQFAASPYLGFFAGLAGAALAVVWVAAWGWIRDSRLPPAAIGEGLRLRSWRGAGGLAVIVAGLGLFAASVAAYLAARRLGVDRPMSELLELAPDWRSWFSAVAGHRWYTDGWPGGERFLAERRLFSGFGPWAGMVGAILAGAIWRRRIGGCVAWSCALAALGLVLFFTAWGERSAFSLLAESFGLLRGFRASGRAVILVHVLQVTALAATLAVVRQVWPAWRRHGWAAAGAAAVGLGLAVEVAAVGQPSVSVERLQMRWEGVVDAWRQAGDRPCLLFAPGFTNEHDQLCQLDAFAAALQLHRHTVNGYSGDVPGSHVTFVHTPTLENGRAVVAATGIDPAEISEVVTWAEPWRSRLGIEHLSGRPVAALEGFALQPVRWRLFAGLERFEIEGRVVYQFTPPAEVLFALPDEARGFEIWQGFRPGSYEAKDRSDGVEISWVVVDGNGREQVVWRRYLNPRDVPDDRGLHKITVAVPPGQSRRLRLVIDVGPADSNAWDWVVFSGLRALR